MDTYEQYRHAFGLICKTLGIVNYGDMTDNEYKAVASYMDDELLNFVMETDNPPSGSNWVARWKLIVQEELTERIILDREQKYLIDVIKESTCVG